MATIIELSKKELPETAYLFKHSTRCPISSSAAEAVKKSELNPLYWINVVEQRELSNWFSESYGVEPVSYTHLTLPTICSV